MPTIAELKIQIKDIAPKQAVSGKNKAELISILETLSAPPKRVIKRPVVAPPVSTPVAVPKRKRPVVASEISTPVPTPEPMPMPMPIPKRPTTDFSIFRNLPSGITNDILNMAGYVSVSDLKKNTPFNMSELFSLGGNQFKARGNSILILLQAIAGGKEGNEKMFFEALATVVPTESYHPYKTTEPLSTILNTFNNRKITTDLSDEAKMIIELFGSRASFPIEAPTDKQRDMMTHLFGDKLKFDLRRRKGTMGSKSGILLNWTPETEGINKRTKAGKEEIDNIYSDSALLASEYLQVINKNIKQILNFSKDVTEKQKKDKLSSKADVRQEMIDKGIVLAPTEKKAEPVSPEDWIDVLQLFFGDRKRAEEEKDRMLRRYGSVPLLLYGRKMLNIKEP